MAIRNPPRNRPRRDQNLPPGADGPPPMVAVPTFASPPPPPWETDPSTLLETAADADYDRDGLVPTASPGATIRGEPVGYDRPGEPRTRTSSDSDAELLTSTNAASLLGSVLRIAAKVLGRILLNAGRELRQPDRDHVDNFARPVARILVRHLPGVKLPADLVDMAEAGEAVNEYLDDGPVAPRINPRVQHVGMEHVEPVTPAAPAPEHVWHEATADPPGIEVPPNGADPVVTYLS